jgi:uncharacterized protein YecT (DUF1311 family)
MNDTRIEQASQKPTSPLIAALLGSKDDKLTEPDSRGVDVEERARTVMAVLREYAEKVAALNKEFGAALINLTSNHRSLNESQVAWLLDQAELMRRPLLAILSRGSGLRENAPIESITRDELSLRMVELEVHLHHMFRHAGELRAKLESWRLAEGVTPLRFAAGLPASYTRS